MTMEKICAWMGVGKERVHIAEGNGDRTKIVREVSNMLQAKGVRGVLNIFASVLLGI